jgi:hypothetical protein
MHLYSVPVCVLCMHMVRLAHPVAVYCTAVGHADRQALKLLTAVARRAQLAVSIENLNAMGEMNKSKAQAEAQKRNRRTAETRHPHMEHIPNQHNAPTRRTLSAWKAIMSVETESCHHGRQSCRHLSARPPAGAMLTWSFTVQVKRPPLGVHIHSNPRCEQSV